MINCLYVEDDQFPNHNLIKLRFLISFFLSLFLTNSQDGYSFSIVRPFISYHSFYFLLLNLRYDFRPQIESWDFWAGEERNWSRHLSSLKLQVLQLTFFLIYLISVMFSIATHNSSITHLGWCFFKILAFNHWNGILSIIFMYWNARIYSFLFWCKWNFCANLWLDSRWIQYLKLTSSNILHYGNFPTFPLRSVTSPLSHCGV